MYQYFCMGLFLYVFPTFFLYNNFMGKCTIDILSQLKLSLQQRKNHFFSRCPTSEITKKSEGISIALLYSFLIFQLARPGN